MSSQNPKHKVPHRAAEVIAVLNTIVPSSHGSNGSTRRWANYLMGAGFGAFLVLIGFALYHKHSRLSDPMLWIALAAGIVAQVLPLLALLPDTLAGLIFIFTFQKKAGEMRLVELHHDMEATQRLVVYSRDVLELTDFWLNQYIERQERRVKLFFSGSDKLAAFSVIGGALTALRQFPEVHGTITKVAPFLGGEYWSSWLSWILVAIFAFLSGLTLGGMLMRQVIQRTCYHRDLLALAQRARKG